MKAGSSVGERVERALRAVMPAGATLDVTRREGASVWFATPAGRISAKWAGEGWLGDVSRVLAQTSAVPDVIVARRMSPGGAAAAAAAGVGWVDETGAAEISRRGIVISRSGHRVAKVPPLARWTPSAVGTSEAILLGTRATVAEIERVTGLSAGAATNALAALTEFGLLRADAARGPGSARRVLDGDRLLDAYAAAVDAASKPPSLRVGVEGRDLMVELGRLGKDWDARGAGWAATGAAGASVLGPYLSEVTGLDLYVDAPTLATLHEFAERSGLRPMDGGRLVMRPFPTPVTRRLCTVAAGLRVAPWPRIYADLRVLGVRGEEAAEHLRATIGRG